MRNVWCEALLRERKSRHSPVIWKPLKFYFCPNLINICLFCLYPNSQVSSPVVTSNPLSFLSSHMLCLLSLYSALSVSLSLSSAYSPFYFYLLPFHINSLMIFTSGIIEYGYLNKHSISPTDCSQ
jgi:hypothetical protein